MQALQAMDYSKQWSFWDLEVDDLIVVLTSPFPVFPSVLMPIYIYIYIYVCVCVALKNGPLFLCCCYVRLHAAESATSNRMRPNL